MDVYLCLIFERISEAPRPGGREQHLLLHIFDSQAYFLIKIIDI
jgi:hypothetical protein